MDQSPSQDIRIGDVEREDALRALGEHFSAGRLDVDEYGERTATATTARTRGELLAVFADLPDPWPHFGAPATPPRPLAAGPGTGPHLARWWRRRSPAQLLTLAAAGAFGAGMILILIETHAKVALVFPFLLLLVFGRMGRHRRDRRR